jgi:hypothetical protein
MRSPGNPLVHVGNPHCSESFGQRTGRALLGDPAEADAKFPLNPPFALKSFDLVGQGCLNSFG